MSEHDFHTEILNRFSKLEQGQASMMSMLAERCTVRGVKMEKMEVDLYELWKREHKRAGERRMFVGLLSILGAIGGIVGSVAVKFLSGGWGR